jgi:CheY-like chemotaxis protein/anti-sigma regulatory factor (Ser/Thr protein kinase)
VALADGDWHFGPADLALAEEIGARAAVAIANARKHEELVRAREEAERANRTNAARYTEPGGEIHLDVVEDGPFVRLSVRDTGAGIPSHLLPRVFESFVQGPRSLDRSQGGLGLGLAIVKNIGELHGGEVSAYSPGPNLGSEFVVRVPRADARADVEALEISSPHLTANRGRRVLVVGDNVDAAETLADALRAHGHDVQVTFDGPAALRLARSFKPQVALLDIGLPVMDGYQLAEEMLELLGPRVMLVAATGYGQPGDVERARLAGFHHHFTKPVDLAGLCRVIDDMGQRREAPEHAARS